MRPQLADLFDKKKKIIHQQAANVTTRRERPHKRGVAGGKKGPGLGAMRRGHLHAIGTDALGRNAIFRSNLVFGPLLVRVQPGEPRHRPRPSHRRASLENVPLNVKRPPPFDLIIQ